ncbi:MAG: hypothetical protein LQ340_007787, partial [Diploschistes diacapsis]
MMLKRYESVEGNKKLLNPETKDEDSVQISDGRNLPADAIIFATGWHPSHNSVFDTDTAAELGLPVAISDEQQSEASHWQGLQKAADQTVLNLYPMLRTPPRSPPPRETTPYRLFRTIAPTRLAATHDNSLAS